MNYSPGDPLSTPLDQRMAAFRSLTLRDVMFWVHKWKWEFLAIATATVLATLAYIMLFRDPVFVSEARLFVRVSQEQTAPRTLVTQEGTTLLTPATSDVTSEIDLFLNSDLADRVIDDARLLEAMAAPPPAPETLVQRAKAAIRAVGQPVRDAIDTVAYATGVKVRLTPREVLTRQIRMSLGVENSRGSNVVVVSMRWQDRDVPQALLQHYMTAFMAFRLEAFQGGDVAYFQRQFDAASDRVRDLEGRIAALRAETGIEDVTVQRGLLIAAREDEVGRIAEAQDTLARIRTRIAALAARGGPDQPLILADLADNPILRLLDERSIALRDERLRLQAQPSLDGLSLAALDQAFRSITDSTRQSIRDHEARIVSEIDAATGSIARIDDRLAQLSAHEARWNALQTELQLASDAYERNARRLSEARSTQDLLAERISNITMIQDPTEARLAPGTRNAVVLTVGAVFAALLAASWVVLREALDGRVWRPADLRAVSGLSLVGLTRRRRRRTLDRDMGMAAAGIAATCTRRGMRTIAFMAVSHETRDPALRTRALAAGLRAMSRTGVEVLNAGRWPDRAPPPEVAPMTGGDDGPLRLIAAPPLFSGAEAMRIASTVDGIVFDIAAGRDDLADIEAAARWVKLNGARPIGMILADVRPYAANGPASTA